MKETATFGQNLQDSTCFQAKARFCKVLQQTAWVLLLSLQAFISKWGPLLSQETSYLDQTAPSEAPSQELSWGFPAILRSPNVLAWFMGTII